MITRINMVILMQHDLTAAIDFYEKLGLKKVFSLEGGIAQWQIDNLPLSIK